MKLTNVILSTFTGETVRPLGEAFVKVDYLGMQDSALNCGKGMYICPVWPKLAHGVKAGLEKCI